MPYIEASKLARIIFPLNLNLRYKGSRRTLSAKLNQFINIFLFPFKNCLHPSVWQVSHPAINVPSVRIISSVRPKENTLNIPTYKYVSPNLQGLFLAAFWHDQVRRLYSRLERLVKPLKPRLRDSGYSPFLQFLLRRFSRFFPLRPQPKEDARMPRKLF